MLVRGGLQIRSFRPYNVRMFAPSEFHPSETFLNEFDHVADPAQFPGPKSLPAAQHDEDLVPSKARKLGWGLKSYAPYHLVSESAYPKRPDLSRKELAVGARVERTDVWKSENEPAIVSISKFSPDNFRAVGYAENANVPESANVEG